MARRGRKRSWGAREKNGRAKRPAKEQLLEERVRFARSMPHRRGIKSNDRIDERAESALGRLNLTRIKVGEFERPLISNGERAAGEAFAAIVATYRTVIEGPRPVRSLMPATAPERQAEPDELAAVRFDCPSQYADPIQRFTIIGNVRIGTRQWPCQLPGAVCICVERRTRYMRVYEAIAAAGRQALIAVIRVAVRGEELAQGELVYLKAGLRAAQRHLGLTDVDG